MAVIQSVKARQISPAGGVLFALVVGQCESVWWSGFPLSQRGSEVPKGRGFIRDLATFASASASEIPPSPPLKKGGSRVNFINGQREQSLPVGHCSQSGRLESRKVRRQVEP